MSYSPPSSTRSTDRLVRVRGAQVNNLRNVDVDVPRDALVMFTGVSGSGKSSLAFHTIYAEAQRRYFDSIAPYARRLLRQVGAPQVREIQGLPPAVALQQRRTVGTARSTVGTLTTLSNSLRMLYSRAGNYPVGVTERLDSDAFSPNTAAGACPECHGIGMVHTVTETSLVPDPTLSIRERAIAAWPGAWQGKNQRDILATLGYDIDMPWQELPKDAREWILFTQEQPVVTVHAEREAHRIQRPYRGTYMSARRYIMRTLAESKSTTQRARAMQFVETTNCAKCGGARLREDALAVTFAEYSIDKVGALPMRQLATELSSARSTQQAGSGSEPVLRDLVSRLESLIELGLGYLSIDRATTTLSAGELQRLRLATQLHSELFGVIYVLDEPSAGLHPIDTKPLLALLDKLKAAGNSIFVVEHDMDIVARADWVVDVGPGAGQHGGKILHSGPVADLENVEESITRKYLFAQATPIPRIPRKPSTFIAMRNITRNNLRNINVDVPRGVFTAVTGVSGAGKSTLVSHELVAMAQSGIDGIDRLVSVDQSPIGRTPRSNLATYTGLFDSIRKEFSATDLARERGYSAGRFSFNVKGGRCETCQGEGFVAIELMFLPGTYAPCPECAGLRYGTETLEVRWLDHNIAQVLALTVDDAAKLCSDVKGAARSLATLRDVGLGYLRLGQPATELSGGEAQRIKLATELQRSARGHALYLLDEPTTGLHPADTDLLLHQLHLLVDAGNTVVVVEHDMNVAAQADWVIDMGPGAGDDGGKVVASGTPLAVSQVLESQTAPYLRERLSSTHL